MLRNLGQLALMMRPTRLLVVLSCLVLVVAQPTLTMAQQGPNGYAPYGANMGGGNSIQPVAASGKASKQRRSLPAPIHSTPDSTETLEIIHNRSQLMITRNAISRIAIANPEIIDVVQYSPTEISIIGLQLGTTNMHIWFEKQADPLIYLVEIIRDPSFDERMKADFGKLEKQLQILFPNSKVYLIPLQQRLIVKGQAKDEEDAAHILQIVRSAYFTEFGPNGYGNGGGYGNGYGNGNGDNNDNDNDDDDDDDFIVNMLEVPGNHQVMLHVKVAELKRNELRRLGVDIRGVIGDYTIGTGTLAAAAATGGAAAAGGAAGNLAGGLASAAGNGGGVTGILTRGQNALLFNWIAANHTGKILASPTVTVLSGHEASFLSGGEFPVQTVVGVGGGASTSTSAYRGYGTSVVVRPLVIDRDWVKLDITSEFSEIDQTLSTGGGGSPALTSRRVTTAVKLREGQTIVLAGLFGHTGSTNVARIPFFGELPLIGSTLFNGKIASQGENELLITVTPELVRPMEPDEVPPYPGFYVTWPNDIELYQYAKTEGYPDQGVYQLSPYGWGPGHGTEIGYRPFNAASFGSPFGSGGGSLGSGMMGPSGGMMSPGAAPLGGGYMVNPQPSQIYPGPPIQSGPQGGMPNGAMQPSADPNMGAIRGGSGVQQISYEQPAKSGGMWGAFSRNNSDASSRNPANLPTNATTPSLQNGNDGRLGPNGQRPVAPPRGRY